MGWIEALILGIIQGLTEFLPVSSSGHLELVKELFGRTTLPEESMLMTVVLHGATALSTIVVFRKDILELLQGIIKWEWNEEMKFAAKIAISMIPAGIIGFALETQIESLFGGQIVFVGSMLLVTAALLLIADKARTTEKNVGFKSSFIIGIAQALAILPGISRSGATISASVMLGIDRTKSARFSFLMVVPIIIGKIILDIFSGDISQSGLGNVPLIVGFLAAFIAGAAACTWMITLVKKAKLKYFAIYCLLIGSTAIGIMVF
ncbi:MAG: undecaprenyl-diphosphate phosphatase [Bacteroidales bacterium]